MAIGVPKLLLVPQLEGIDQIGRRKVSVPIPITYLAPSPPLAAARHRATLAAYLIQLPVAAAVGPVAMGQVRVRISARAWTGTGRS
jgi:hypothetical protein